MPARAIPTSCGFRNGPPAVSSAGPRDENSMMPGNAVVNRPLQPTVVEVAAALGPAKDAWDQLLSELAQPNGVRWAVHLRLAVGVQFAYPPSRESSRHFSLLHFAALPPGARNFRPSAVFVRTQTMRPSFRAQGRIGRGAAGTSSEPRPVDPAGSLAGYPRGGRGRPDNLSRFPEPSDFDKLRDGVL